MFNPFSPLLPRDLHRLATHGALNNNPASTSRPLRSVDPLGSEDLPYLLPADTGQNRDLCRGKMLNRRHDYYILWCDPTFSVHQRSPFDSCLHAVSNIILRFQAFVKKKVDTIQVNLMSIIGRWGSGVDPFHDLVKQCGCRGRSSGPRAWLKVRGNTCVAGYNAMVCDECQTPWVRSQGERRQGGVRGPSDP